MGLEMRLEIQKFLVEYPRYGSGGSHLLRNCCYSKYTLGYPLRAKYFADQVLDHNLKDDQPNKVVEDTKT